MAVESRNPWTHLRLNRSPDQFQFAVISDRTGGHRAGVFSRAVELLNLLQPEFVLSVGDLIEGYAGAGEAREQWKEFQGYVGKLQMPFFYVAGNHDVSNAAQVKLWKEKFGRTYYSFTYKNVLFLMLNTGSLAAIIATFVIAFAICQNSLAGSQGAWFAELFTTNTRSSGASLAYQLSAVVSGFDQTTRAAASAAHEPNIGDGSSTTRTCSRISSGMVLNHS